MAGDTDIWRCKAIGLSINSWGVRFDITYSIPHTPLLFRCKPLERVRYWPSRRSLQVTAGTSSTATRSSSSNPSAAAREMGDGTVLGFSCALEFTSKRNT